MEVTIFPRSAVRNYVALMKFRVIALLVFVAVMTAYTAKGWSVSSTNVLALAVVGVLSSGGSGAINAYIDRDIDAQMHRTSRRPIPSGAISPPENAVYFGAAILVLSVALAVSFLNLLSAVFVALGALIYVAVYSLWLKRRTPYSIIYGGIAGCCPVLAGWAAATNAISIKAVMMALLVLAWIPAHNWTFSILAKRDYEKVAVPVLSVTKGEDQALKYSSIGFLVTLSTAAAIYLLGAAKLTYLAVIVTASLAMLPFWGRAFKADSVQGCRGLYKALSLYLATIFVGLALDTFAAG